MSKYFNDINLILVVFYFKGSIFSEYFRRYAFGLAFNWNVIKYHQQEPDRPEYTHYIKERENYLEDKNILIQYFNRNERYLKQFVSVLILVLMVCRMIDYKF